MRVRKWLSPIAAVYLTIAAAACGDPEEKPTDGSLVLNVHCINAGCDRTGTLIAQHKECGGDVLSTTTAAGVTLNTAVTGAPYVITWEPVPAGEHCINAVLETTAGTIVSGTTGGDIAVTIVHGERLTVRVNLGTLVP